MIPSHDPDVLRQQYGSDEFLRLRQSTHDRFSVPKVDFPAWVLSRVKWSGSERILDVGTGTGTYYQALLASHQPHVQYVGLDLSFGMLETHLGHGKVSVGDAQMLPIPSGTFDVVMANHMLYHIPNISQALTEFKRVLKPDGILIAATNSLATMPELNFLYQRALILLSQSGSPTSPLPIHSSFALENGTRILARNFYAVVRHDLPTTLVFPHSDPMIDYMETLRILREPTLPEGVTWNDVMMVMREQANRVIGALGELVIQKIAGVLIASDHGGALRDFLSYVNKE